MTLNLDNLDEETKKKILNLQNLQQNLEFITSQKIQMETALNETISALNVLENANPEDTVYKSIGGILVKSERNKLLDEKKSLKVTLEMRVKTLEQKRSRTESTLNTLKNSVQKDLQDRS
jgi:prefoldin beta subunit